MKFRVTSPTVDDSVSGHRGVMMPGLPTDALHLAEGIALVAMALTVTWVLFLLLWKLLNLLRPFHILGGRYAISDIIDPPEYKGIGEIVRSRIGDEVAFARKGVRTFQNVDSPDALVPSQVPPLSNELKGLGPLINILLRRDRFVVTVIALAPVGNRVTLHVRLSRSTGKLLASRRFTEPVGKEGETEAYSGAAMMAGSWLAFKLEQYANSRFAKNPSLHLFGTGSWLSYAWLCRGLRHTQSIDDSIAWFHAALRVDHRNIGALIALGKQMSMGLGYSTSERENMDMGIRHLEYAREQLISQRLGLRKIYRLEYPCTRANPQWYQVTYALVVAYRNYYAAFSDAADPCPFDYLERAVQLGAELAQATAATELTLISTWRKWAIKGSRRKELQKAFRRDESDLASVVAISKACLEIRQNWNHQPDVPLPDWEPSNKHELWKLLRKIDPRNLESLPPAQNLRIAQECGSIPGSNQQCHLTPKTRYNSACYYVCIHDFEKALEELRLVFFHVSSEPRGAAENVNYTSRKWFIEWAIKDPELKQLRADKGDEFNEIIDGARIRFSQKTLTSNPLGEQCDAA